MYQVGTNVGNANTERQGTGYATVIDTPMTNAVIGSQVDEAVRQRALQQQRLTNAHKIMTDFDPKPWYIHDREVQGMIRENNAKGGKLVTSGIDPYTSADPASSEFVSEQKRIIAYANASMQMREDFAKLQSAYANNTNSFQEKVENWPEIAEFYANPSVKDVVDNGKLPPTPKFRQPLTDTQGVTNTILKGWEEASGEKVMGWDAATELAKSTLQNPKMSEGIGGGYLGVQRQLYNSLSQEDKMAMTNRGSRYGLDGLGMFIASDFHSKRTATVSLADMAAEIGRNAPMTGTKIEGENFVTDNTRYTGGEKALKAQLRSKFTVNRGQVEREVEAGLYGSMDASAEDNIEAAVNKYYRDVTSKNLKSDFSRTKAGDDSAGSDKDMEAGFDRWWRALESGDINTMAGAVRYIDKGVIFDLLPGGMQKSTMTGQDERILDASANPSGDMVVNTTKRQVVIPRATKEEAFKNAYAKTFKKVGRNYSTTEAGTAPTASPTASNVAPSYQPGFLNKN